MLTSRMLGVLRTTRLLNRPITIKQSIRNRHDWYYRCGVTKPQTKAIYLAEGIQGFVWWWILWHMWTQPGHVIGEFPFPNPSKWTDEELGIPAK